MVEQDVLAAGLGVSDSMGESSRPLHADQHASSYNVPASRLSLITHLEPQSESGGPETTGAAAAGGSGAETLVAPRRCGAESPA